MFLFHLQKNLVSFGGLKLHTKLLEGANLIIQNAKERDEQWVNDMSSKLNPYKLRFLIWDLTNFILVSILPIAFNCTQNCLLNS